MDPMDFWDSENRLSKRWSSKSYQQCTIGNCCFTNRRVNKHFDEDKEYQCGPVAGLELVRQLRGKPDDHARQP